MEHRAGELARIVREVDPDGPSDVRFIVPLPARAADGRIGILAGSFNPPTAAHVALARAGRRAGLDAVVFLLSKRTVDKERVTGLELADRLLLLERIAQSSGDALAFGNTGLYVDQAQALQRHLPRAELTFLVGYDKIVQIFDPRYYEDRDKALRQLFATASFLVAPRDGAGRQDLADLLDRPENQPFAKRVHPLAVPRRHLTTSATRVRAGALADVPAHVRRFLDLWQPYAPRGPYDERARQLRRS